MTTITVSSAWTPEERLRVVYAIADHQLERRRLGPTYPAVECIYLIGKMEADWLTDNLAAIARDGGVVVEIQEGANDN